jgi:hypothetical protein
VQGINQAARVRDIAPGLAHPTETHLRQAEEHVALDHRITGYRQASLRVRQQCHDLGEAPLIGENLRIEEPELERPLLLLRSTHGREFDAGPFGTRMRVIQIAVPILPAYVLPE